MRHNNALSSNDPIIFTAKYCDTKIPEFKGNPLIEALPPIATESEWAQKIGEYPCFNPEERDEAGYIRAYYISRLTHFFQPLPDHLELANAIERLIKWGYVGRNPNTAEREKLRQESYEASMAGKLQTTSYSEYHPIMSMSLMGASGMGKSTTVERILGHFPQVLYHPDSGDHQVTWLKLDCAHNGEIKEIGLNFYWS